MDYYNVPSEEIVFINDKKDFLSKKEISDRNIHQILRLYGQVNDGSFDVYEDIVDENIHGHGPASGQETHGRIALKKLDESYLVAYPDAEITIQDIISKDDKVVVRWNWRGTHRGVYKGILPTNKKITVDGIHIYRFNSQGKIIEVWATHDRLGEFEQLGLFSISSLAKNQERNG